MQWIARRHLSKVTHVYQPLVSRPWKTDSVTELRSTSHKYLFDHGFIESAGRGLFHYLPLAHRVLDKLIGLIDAEMEHIGAQRLLLSALTEAKLWRRTGRWDTGVRDFFTLKDRDDIEYCLAPTCEEAITDLIIQQQPMGERRFPLLLYQTSMKYRDEVHPRFGLIRGREFLMKDLYSFDSSDEQARQTYNRVCEAYERIFGEVGIRAMKVEASVGNIGGRLSHEYQVECSIGQDYIHYCDACRLGQNEEIRPKDASPTCGTCKTEMKRLRTIEVGHTFLLGTKYSQVFGAQCIDAADSTLKVLEMGCFGIGVTRLLAAIVETFCRGEACEQRRWPLKVAPYKIYVIGPKTGAKEEGVASLAHEVAVGLDAKPGLRGEVLFDDRTSLSVGRRLREAKAIGYPWIIVVNKQAMQSVPMFELFDLTAGKELLLSHSDMFEMLAGKR